MPPPLLLNSGTYTGKVIHRIMKNGLNIAITHYPIGWYEGGLHSHEYPHICLIFQGGDIENRNRLSYQRKAGQIFFYHAGETHQTISRKQYSKNVNIELENEFLTKYELSEEQIAISVVNNIDTKFLALKILEEIRINDCCSSSSINMLTLNLIDHAEKEKHCTIPKWVIMLSDLLNDRWSEQFTLAELSESVGAHPVTISKGFRRYFLCTYGEYMRKLKVDKSISYIKNSKMSLTEIAFRCGFSDQSHFTRSFKQSIGFLPKYLREL